MGSLFWHIGKKEDKVRISIQRLWLDKQVIDATN